MTHMDVVLNHVTDLRKNKMFYVLFEGCDMEGLAV